MHKRVLVKEKKAEVIEPSANDREKPLNAAISKRLNSSKWIEEAKEQELEAFDLRTQVGQLSREFYKAEKDGNMKLASNIRRKKASVLEKLSEI